MNYKQKYEEALERARKMQSNILGIDFISSIFPELKESEDKRFIMEYLYDGLQKSDEQFKLQFKSAIAWLEKQGELKGEENQQKLSWDFSDKSSDEYQIILSKWKTLTDEGKNKYNQSINFNDSNDKLMNTVKGAEVPSKEMILAVWELGNIWKELTEGNPYTEYGTQLQYIQNHWSESPYYEKLKQNHTDKITPKFNVGDWVVKNDDSSVCVDYSICKITKVENGNYTIESIYGYKGYVTFKTFEKDYHIFTIEDAKDGDVVVDKSDGTIGIFQSIGHHPDGGSYNDPSYCFLHCRYDDGFFYAGFENGNTMDSDDVIPATKKQRERLEKAISDAGYEWDADKKKLKIIDWSKHIKSEPNSHSITEEKSANKVEPKFKVGDLIVNEYCMGRVVEVTDDAYLLDTGQGIPFSCNSTRLLDINKDTKE